MKETNIRVEDAAAELGITVYDLAGIARRNRVVWDLDHDDKGRPIVVVDRRILSLGPTSAAS